MNHPYYLMWQDSECAHEATRQTYARILVVLLVLNAAVFAYWRLG